MSKGLIGATVKGLSDAMGEIAAMDKKADKALTSTVNEFGSRGKGWVNKAIAEHYRITSGTINKESFISKTKDGKVKVSGRLVDNVGLSYKSGLLSISAFGMKPKKPPAPRSSGTPGGAKKVRPRKPYQITAEIKRGSTATLPQDAFLASMQGGSVKPFQRKGKERLPIKVVKTLSVAQMISNKKVSESIKKKIGEEMPKRLEHHVKRQMKK